MVPKTYRQLVITGNADHLSDAVALVEQPLRLPGPGQVLIRNRFAGVNGIYDNRLGKGQIIPPDPKAAQNPPFCFGFESVGEVAAVGPGVKDLVAGDAVATVKFGHAYCEYHTIDAAAVIPVPEVSPAILTLIPTGTSALVALEQVGELSSGERVLISAAAGGLGHIAVQVAKQRGNHVTALTGNAAKVERLSALGLDRVVNYRTEDLDSALAEVSPSGFDLILDTVGGVVFDTLVEHLANHGRLVVSGFSSDADNPQAVTQQRIYTRLYWKAASVRAFMNPLFASYQADARRRLLDTYQQGLLQVWVHEPLFKGLENLPRAVDCLLSGQNLGKVILQI